MTDGIDALTPEEEAAATAAYLALRKGMVGFDDPAWLLDELQGIWSGVAFDRKPGPVGVMPPPRPEWLLGMSDEFRKAVTSIDRKLQGRLLEAIAHISVDPLTLRGDTVKPLNAEMKGLWRYRIGDSRLVYHPDASNRRILLVAFTARGDAYA